MRVNPAPESQPATPASMNETVIHSAAGAFCPAGGLIRSDSGFHQEQRNYLRNRLRMATFVLLCGFFGFLLLDFVRKPADSAGIEQTRLALQAAITLVMGGLCIGLTRWSPSASVLRALEFVTFGIPAAFFIWVQYGEAMQMAASLPPADLPFEFPPGFQPPPGAVAMPLPPEFAASLQAVPWILISQLYGVFIPNPWKRASIIVVTLCLAPIVVTLLVLAKAPALRIEGQSIAALVMYMTISGVIAIYGSHRFGSLRREAYDAKSLGAYTLREKLGAGGMGEVYLAEHRLLKRPAAIKLIRPEKAGDANAIARFEGEVQATAALTHPNTVEIYDYGRTDDGTFYYVMEFLPGLNLQDLVDRYGPMPAERVVHLLSQVCSALREAHRAGLIHRDIKPGNIFACERGGLFDFAKLLDFGLVKSIRPEADLNLTGDGAVVGSPLYSAPEAMLDDVVDPRVDIYSLGATGYFLLTGRPVFTGSKPLKVIMAHQNDPVAPPSQHAAGVPADLESLILKCLEKSRDRRYASIQQLEQALSDCGCAGKWTSEQAFEWWIANEDVNLSVSDTAVNTSTMTTPVKTSQLTRSQILRTAPITK
jgi:eukaryotic-like serine/threonine-protein kinase